MRPLVALVAAVALVATLGSGLPASADPSEDGDEVRIGTYNIRADRTAAQLADAVTALKARVDVAGLQEISGRPKHELLRSDPLWGYYRPPETGLNPVIWDRTEFLMAGVPEQTYRIAQGRRVESKDGSHLERKRASFATVVRLRHLPTGRLVSIVNVHLISNASWQGRPLPRRPRRFALLTDQVAGTQRVVRTERRLGHDVYLLGDFNVGFQADKVVRHRKLPYRRYGRLRMRSMWAGVDLARRGTYGRAYLDQVWSRTRPVAREVGYEFRWSDHRPAVATYRWEQELPGGA